MTAPIAAALIAVGAVLAEIAFPGRPVYHAGWYNVGLIALIVIAFIAGRPRFAGVGVPRKRFAIVAIVGGAAVAVLAGVGSGLFGPDNQTIVGAPGQRVAVEGLGALVFPVPTAEITGGEPVRLERAGHASMDVGERKRYIGSFIVRRMPRDVAYVEARDLNGNRLTVTQPMGSAFLSPVLLMQHQQTIAGLDLPFDSFSVPAERRIVKALLFTPAQAAMVLHGARLGETAVLFAVDDQNDRPLPNAIALSDGGRPVRVDRLILRGVAGSYPAVEVVSAPNLVVSAIGSLLALAGLVALIV